MRNVRGGRVVCGEEGGGLKVHYLHTLFSTKGFTLAACRCRGFSVLVTIHPELVTCKTCLRFLDKKEHGFVGVAIDQRRL